MSRECNDLSGMTFGFLTVIKKDESIKPSKSGYVMAHWICKCICGKMTSSTADSLRNKGVKSCGCARSKKLKPKRRKKNNYDLSGEYGIGWTTNTNEEFYFDLEDYDLIKDFTWSNSNPKKYGHLVSTKMNSENVKKERVNFHRLVFDCSNGMVIDHINHNRLDNRKENLRMATIQQNAINTTKSNRRSNSEFIGIYKRFRKTDGVMVWYSILRTNGECKYLGSHTSIESAIVARLKAEKEYFGVDFAPQRHLFEKYGI